MFWKEGLRSLEVAGWSDWWEWKRGSRLFFWRWPVEFIDFALEGSKPCFFKLPGINMTRQGGIKDPNILKKVKLKVDKVIRNGYVEIVSRKHLKSVLNVFHVPKGIDDIRLVYDATKSGLNPCLHAPWFTLPTIDTMVRTLNEDSWCSDNDYGDHFLNFPMRFPR